MQFWALNTLCCLHLIIKQSADEKHKAKYIWDCTFKFILDARFDASATWIHFFSCVPLLIYVSTVQRNQTKKKNCFMKCNQICRDLHNSNSWEPAEQTDDAALFWNTPLKQMIDVETTNIKERHTDLYIPTVANIAAVHCSLCAHCSLQLKYDSLVLNLGKMEHGQYKAFIKPLHVLLALSMKRGHAMVSTVAVITAACGN